MIRLVLGLALVLCTAGAADQVAFTPTTLGLLFLGLGLMASARHWKGAL